MTAFCAVAITLGLTACSNTNDAAESEYATTFPAESLYKIAQVEDQPFMGETYINDYDYDAGNQFLIKNYVSDAAGACSSFRAGGYAARNLDWYIRDYAMLVVHLPANAAKGRYASVGIVSSIPFVNKAMIAGGVVSDTVIYNDAAVGNWRNIMPIFTTDGINEKGVCVNTNIVMHEEGVREGYVPCNGNGEPYTSFISLPRYVLDNCVSADDAVAKCSKLSVRQACRGPFASEDCHLMVSDKDKTVVIEWLNNKMVYTEYKNNGNNLYVSDNNMPAIMTNFYNCIGDKHLNADGTIDLASILSVHPYAMGVERYNTLRDGLEKVNSVETAAAQIEKVLYTHFYDLSKGWYTENGASCKRIDGTWYYPTDPSFAASTYKPAANIVEAVKNTYAEGSLQPKLIESFGSFEKRMEDLNNGIESKDEWYTELTDIFDINNKVLYVMPQQGYFKNEFTPFTVHGNYKP